MGIRMQGRTQRLIQGNILNGYGNQDSSPSPSRSPTNCNEMSDIYAIHQHPW
ncbi:hypothetical protein FC50_GL002130 [Lacticaseibacillus pantheris DSM 15945 = JCM 12539 = NBRC 106106]|uniref:Uncharacterized protein n=1 Tax=Lacticaseibacillus pantheris DSM 15945 = JCM 12539 = NBRC 106106 TaxID=1423783 RepID=A0A0R1U3H3_9LACO|nr:hypothetical protein FC50_GL002130 [Lacticaseibacillus pantheris DSM 15945 = JCM 12539 = NBRC 106106]